MKVAILLLFLSSNALADTQLPDYLRTTDKDVICNTKTETVRSVPTWLRKEVFIRDGVPLGNHTGYCKDTNVPSELDKGCELDHDTPLELGGSNAKSNLKVKPYFGTCNMTDKDVLENKLHRLLCKTKTISVEEAQSAIRNWKESYRKYVNPKGCGE